MNGDQATLVPVRSMNPRLAMMLCQDPCIDPSIHEFEKKSIKQVSLFYRTDSQPRYREISFPPKSKRYSYTYNPKKNPANYITYFFKVELVDGKVFATPIDDSGILNPITMNLVDPFEYYKQRAEGKN